MLLKDKKVFVVYGSEYDSSWTGLTYTKKYEDADVVLFTGGSDINPKYYGENKGKYTYCSESRDTLEFEYLNRAIKDGKYLIGICRGHQWLGIMAGCRLIQHVDNHGSQNHAVVFNNGDLLRTNSIHHQMVNPFTLDSKEFELIAWTVKNHSDRYLNGDDEETVLPDNFVECEVVYFNKIKGFGVQSHPEMQNYDCAFNTQLRKNLKQILGITKEYSNSQSTTAVINTMEI